MCSLMDSIPTQQPPPPTPASLWAICQCPGLPPLPEPMKTGGKGQLQISLKREGFMKLTEVTMRTATVTYKADGGSHGRKRTGTGTCGTLRKTGDTLVYFSKMIPLIVML